MEFESEKEKKMLPMVALAGWPEPLFVALDQEAWEKSRKSNNSSPLSTPISTTSDNSLSILSTSSSVLTTSTSPSFVIKSKPSAIDSSIKHSSYFTFHPSSKPSSTLTKPPSSTPQSPPPTTFSRSPTNKNPSNLIISKSNPRSTHKVRFAPTSTKTHTSSTPRSLLAPTWSEYPFRPTRPPAPVSAKIPIVSHSQITPYSSSSKSTPPNSTQPSSSTSHLPVAPPHPTSQTQKGRPNQRSQETMSTGAIPPSTSLSTHGGEEKSGVSVSEKNMKSDEDPSIPIPPRESIFSSSCAYSAHSPSGCQIPGHPNCWSVHPPSSPQSQKVSSVKPKDILTQFKIPFLPQKKSSPNDRFTSSVSSMSASTHITKPMSQTPAEQPLKDDYVRIASGSRSKREVYPSTFSPPDKRRRVDRSTVTDVGRDSLVGHSDRPIKNGNNVGYGNGGEVIIGEERVIGSNEVGSGDNEEESEKRRKGGQDGEGKKKETSHTPYPLSIATASLRTSIPIRPASTIPVSEKTTVMRSRNTR
ncbi:hypothetical protein TREMEDRAFT_74075 [Tremella mesenterica DSM 1558]|uniref:uncharacterized protein n=1 Tax=Tremella mesenterica (strain ATCC 24925 / CBS 8224 / DSM 1558 / NBRC 9311 / NRRL Y-6157 / RJB 2259-6 / UBC 559-6) TaxID=578456 RepID=UPI0003F4974C|nr:uncharacterized protein TREMEDRAFT_74075 [Tremella mesenterica DSM 1558]EIW68519.1 hypothetical protein TREMEDRAFT_74075 [Tremella mesenterica DSM 1558]